MGNSIITLFDDILFELVSPISFIVRPALLIAVVVVMMFWPLYTGLQPLCNGDCAQYLRKEGSETETK